MLRIGQVELPSNLLLAPIAGYCDLSYRAVVRPLGGLGLACTDLINPRGLIDQTPRTMELLATDENDKPLCIQLYGHEPDYLARAAASCIELGADIIDINMGCPTWKVCRRGAGANLMKHPDKAVTLVQRVIEAVSVPVTVKMRLGWDDRRIIAPELARAMEQIGVAAVTVHGRTAEQKFGGFCRVDEIARVVEAVDSMPVIGNGDVNSPQDAREMFERTGCTGVMIGRAALKDPWIFRDTQTYMATGQIPCPPTLQERLDLMNRQFDLLVTLRGERRACLSFRQRVIWYAKRLPACADFRARMQRLSSIAEYRQIISEFTTLWANPLAPFTAPD
jgi:nifR3 family TIM-barrel protein